MIHQLFPFHKQKSKFESAGGINFFSTQGDWYQRYSTSIAHDIIDIDSCSLSNRECCINQCSNGGSGLSFYELAMYAYQNYALADQITFRFVIFWIQLHGV